MSSKAVVVLFWHRRTLVGALPFLKSHKAKIRSDRVLFNQSFVVIHLAIIEFPPAFPREQLSHNLQYIWSSR